MKVKEDGNGNITFGERKPEHIDGVTVLSNEEWIARHEMLHQQLCLPSTERRMYIYPTPKAYNGIMKLRMPDSSGSLSKDVIEYLLKDLNDIDMERVNKICRDFMINDLIEEEWKKEKLDSSEEDVKV